MKTVLVAGLTVIAFAQSTARGDLARGAAFWDERLSKSAIAALESAARDPETAAAAHEALGRLYAFKGWQQEGVFPGWHDEPAFRDRAIAELKASLAADPNRLSAQDALRMVEGFAAAEAVDPAPPRPEIRALDAKLQSSTTASSAADVVAAVEARAKAQADPSPYFTGAQILIDRGDYDRAIALAERGAAASDRFIDENVSAYQLPGKSQGAYARGRGTAADLVGWALFKKNDYAGAAAKLEEAERLAQSGDLTNEFHLGELFRARNDPASARDHFLTALSATGGPAPLRQRITQALASVSGHAAGPDFDAWLDAELTRRREERRTAALASLVDRPLPRLPLTTVDGRPFDTAPLRGKILLLNFFASW